MKKKYKQKKKRKEKVQWTDVNKFKWWQMIIYFLVFSLIIGLAKKYL